MTLNDIEWQRMALNDSHPISIINYQLSIDFPATLNALNNL